MPRTPKRPLPKAYETPEPWHVMAEIFDIPCGSETSSPPTFGYIGADPYTVIFRVKNDGKPGDCSFTVSVTSGTAPVGQPQSVAPGNTVAGRARLSQIKIKCDGKGKRCRGFIDVWIPYD